MRLGGVWYTLGWVALGALLWGCDEPAPPSVATWPCPPRWVRASGGGCGPAVLLCVPDGGAAAGACSSVDLADASAVPGPDGSTMRGFYRRSDGTIGGEWREPGEPDGPPAETWRPETGVGECRMGWLRSRDGTCNPRMLPVCPDGAEALPGGRCTPTALEDCPSGRYADVAAEAGDAPKRYVLAEAPSGGTGTIDSPFQTIEAALSGAPSGTWVLVGAGTYRDHIGRGSGTTRVVGVCAARVTLENDGRESGVGVDARNINTVVDVRGVTLRGYRVGLLARGGTVHARGLVVEDSAGAGALLSERRSTVDIADSIIRRTHNDMRTGMGLVMGEGHSATLTRVAFRSNDTGVAASWQDPMAQSGLPMTLTVSDCVIRGSGDASSECARGGGVIFYGGGALQVTGSVVLGNRCVGVSAGHAADVTVAQSLIEGTLGGGTRLHGIGLDVIAARSLRVTDVVLQRNTKYGLVLERTSDTQILRSVVANTVGTSETGGAGLFALGDGSLTVENTRFEGNASSGVSVYPGATLSLRRSEVVRTRPVAAGVRNGQGILVRGATLQAEDVLLEENTTFGILAFLPEASVTWQQGRISRTAGEGRELNGSGAVVAVGASMSLARVLVDHNEGLGLVAMDEGTRAHLARVALLLNGNAIDANATEAFAMNGARLSATGLLTIGGNFGLLIGGAGTRADVWGSCARSVRADPTGLGGYCVGVDLGAELRGHHLLALDGREGGIYATRAGSMVVLDDTIVEGMRGTIRGLGVGVGAVGATLSGDRLAVRATQGAALMAVEHPIGPTTGSAAVRDLWIDHVTQSQIGLAPGAQLSGEGPPTAYGLHTSGDASVQVEHAVIAGGDFAVASNGGSIRVDSGVLGPQRRACVEPGSTRTEIASGVTRTCAPAPPGNVERGRASALLTSASRCSSGSDCLPTGDEERIDRDGGL